MKSQRSNDSNFLMRAFFIHCFLHIYQVITALDPTHLFRPPRFELFQKIKKKFVRGPNSLFRNILSTYRWHIVRGGILTCIFVFFNLLVPELIKMFMHFMHGHHSQKKQVNEASGFIRNLVGVQILRIVFGQHSRRVFHQLAIKIQSSLSKMLIQKSLYLTQKSRRDIPNSQILQLQNVDLKLVFTMINNMMFVFQAPLTIFVAIIMLFIQNRTYGFIGVYWFLIAFLLHRELDQKMTHCNTTKLGLIEQRSKVNYQMLFGIKQARLIGWQDTMIQKNNDLFEHENHDHYIFYFYNCLYDIILLMLPVLVVVTICVVDLNEANPIKVEQVYLMLSLLGICYEPMKNIRTISISFHDGLHSLNRLQQYFDLPEEKKNQNFVNQKIQQGHLWIQKGTSCGYPGVIFDFYIQTKFQIQLGPGQRLIFLGRKGQGKSSFLSLINGFMERMSGQVRINGRKAFISQHLFFLKASVKDNIIFHNQHISQQEIDKVSAAFGITEELKKLGGLSCSMDDLNKFSKSLLQRISLARVLCSEAQIYILDKPLQNLEPNYEKVFDQLLRKKQKEEKVLIIMSLSQIFYSAIDDKIAIIQNGIVEEYGSYEQLIQNTSSTISNYFRSNEEKLNQLSPDRKNLSLAIKKFKDGVGKIMTENKMKKVFDDIKSKKKILKPLKDDQHLNVHDSMKTSIMRSSVFEGIDKVASKIFHSVEQKQKQTGTFKKFVSYFIFSVPIIQILFIMLIIACAELLHVFIHFFIGHLQQQHGDHSYSNFRSMIVVEVLLTFGLAGVLYYEGEVSSMIAIIQGNKIYKSSLVSLVRKNISYFISEYSVKIADKFNHDYEQVFIACHSLLTIYKNVIILLVTVIFISSDGLTVLTFFTIVVLLYTSIYLLFRKVQNKVIVNYYDYKYDFVKCFEESLQGAQYFDIFGIKNYLIKRAERKYKRLASYKLAQKYTNYGLSIACDIIGNILLASIVYYGLQMKIHHTRANIALIATSIHLLMNGSQVLKNILKETINFQTFFNINLLPFLQVIDKNSQEKPSNYEIPEGYEINFKALVIVQTGKVQKHKLSLKIKEKQRIFIYESNEAFRDLLLYSLTNNLEIPQWVLNGEDKNIGQLLIGNANITKINPQLIMKTVGVVLSKNFYFTGTLRENIVRKIQVDEQQINEYVHVLKLDEDIEDFDLYGMQSKIVFDNRNINYQITKKFAVLRILLYKSKIVIIKDTPSFVGSISIVDLLNKYIPDCTIIKIDSRIEASYGMDRIVHMRNSVIVKDDTAANLMNNQTSQISLMLKDANMEDYMFKNQVSRAKIKDPFKVKHY